MIEISAALHPSATISAPAPAGAGGAGAALGGFSGALSVFLDARDARGAPRATGAMPRQHVAGDGKALPDGSNQPGDDRADPDAALLGSPIAPFVAVDPAALAASAIGGASTDPVLMAGVGAGPVRFGPDDHPAPAGPGIGAVPGPSAGPSAGPSDGPGIGAVPGPSAGPGSGNAQAAAAPAIPLPATLPPAPATSVNASAVPTDRLEIKLRARSAGGRASSPDTPANAADPGLGRLKLSRGDAAALQAGIVIEASTPVGEAVSTASPRWAPMPASAPGLQPNPTGSDGPAAASVAAEAAPVPSAPVTSARPAAGAPIQPAGQAFAAAIAAAVASPASPASLHRDGVDDRADRTAIDPARVDPATGTPSLASHIAATHQADQQALDLRHDNGLQAMIDRIETLRDDADARDTRIKLVPDALGSIDCTVHRDGDTINLHFAAEHQATRDLLGAAQPRLEQLAEARGVRLGSTTIDQPPAGFGQSGREQGSGRRSDQNAASPASAVAPDQAPADLTGRLA